MASQGPHNTSGYSSGQVPGQAQMRRNDLVNQPSDMQNQDHQTSFLQDTGTQISNMAQGAALGAVNMAKGAATGAANIAHGAADAVKNTLGMNTTDNTTNCHPAENTNLPTNTTNYPGNIHHPNPNTRI